MNVFAVSKHPRKCARALDDARLRKMILETAQMLCTAINLQAGKQVTPYKNSHIHSSLVKWCLTPAHWNWLWELGEEMGKEYEYRFGKRHASSEVIGGLENYYRVEDHHRREICWVNAAANDKHGINFKHVDKVHKAYRLYLNARWDKETTHPRPSGRIMPPTWTRRGEPPWRT